VLQVAFLDVGQGDSALITFPDGKTMLIDGGETSEGVALVGKLRRLGVRQIDWLVATHPHSDHIGGLIQVLKAFPVAEVWDIGMPFESPVYRDFLLAARGARSPDGKRPKFRVVRRGLTLEPAPNVRVSVLAPSDPLLAGTRSDPNNNSIVLRVDAPGGSFLFTGDLEREGRARLYTTRPNLRADVLKVAHHGAENGTDRAFLSRVNPAVAVISAGAGNRYGHPHRETLALLQGRRVYRTDLHGDIVMRLGADKKLQIATTRAAPTRPTAPAKPTPAVGAVIGNRNSKVYHRPDCRRLPKPENQIRFRSAQEAERQATARTLACRVSSPLLHHHIRAHVLQPLGANPAHLQQFVHGLEPAVRLAVLDNPLRQHGTDTGDGFQLLGGGGVEVDGELRRGGSGLRRPARRSRWRNACDGRRADFALARHMDFLSVLNGFGEVEGVEVGVFGCAACLLDGVGDTAFRRETIDARLLHRARHMHHHFHTGRRFGWGRRFRGRGFRFRRLAEVNHLHAALRADACGVHRAARAAAASPAVA
jgi:competence protein ComEC